MGTEWEKKDGNLQSGGKINSLKKKKIPVPVQTKSTFELFVSVVQETPKQYRLSLLHFVAPDVEGEPLLLRTAFT